MMALYVVLAVVSASLFIVSIRARSTNLSIYHRPVKVESIMLLFLPILIIPFIYAGLKPFNAGGDTMPYLFSFNRLGNVLTATRDAGYGKEFLFWPLQALIKVFTGARGWIITNFLISAALTYFAYVRLLRGSSFTPLIFVFCYLTFYIVYSSNVMRQALAIPLIFIALTYVHDKNIKGFVFFILLAIGFHWSSVLYILYPIFIKLTNGRRLLLTITPLVALALSPMANQITQIIVELTGFAVFEEKHQLYVAGNRISHVGVIWEKLNFWFCCILFLFLALSYKSNSTLHKTTFSLTSYILSVIMISIFLTDISERNFPFVLLLSPLILAITIERLSLPILYKNAIYFSAFAATSLLVFSRESTIITLGIGLL